MYVLPPTSLPSPHLFDTGHISHRYNDLTCNRPKFQTESKKATHHQQKMPCKIFQQKLRKHAHRMGQKLDHSRRPHSPFYTPKTSWSSMFGSTETSGNHIAVNHPSPTVITPKTSDERVQGQTPGTTPTTTSSPSHSTPASSSQAVHRPQSRSAPSVSYAKVQSPQPRSAPSVSYAKVHQQPSEKRCTLCDQWYQLHEFRRHLPSGSCQHENKVCMYCLHNCVQQDYQRGGWANVRCRVCSQRMTMEEGRRLIILWDKTDA
jgi:hypothetical protein